VILRFLASPLNPADINQIQGLYPSRPQLTTALGTTQPSAVAGNEGVAEILSAGSAVKTVQKGDWVIMKRPAFGTWRTHAEADQSDILRIEGDGITRVQAATVSVNPCTAYRMLKDFYPLQPGDWFIQNGANSGVGRAAIQFGKRWGLRSINVVRDRPGLADLKRELQDLGADHVVTEDEVLARDFAERTKEWTRAGRELIMLALNCVGGKPATALTKVLSPGGHLVTYGTMAKKPIELPPSALIFRDLHFHGFWVSQWGDAHPEAREQTVHGILGMMKRGELRDVPVTEVEWGWETKEKTLVEAVQGTMEGFRAGKGVFLFKDE
jgi:trans-2-enoyl-CoA reductase